MHQVSVTSVIGGIKPVNQFIGFCYRHSYVPSVVFWCVGASKTNRRAFLAESGNTTVEGMASNQNQKCKTQKRKNPLVGSGFSGRSVDLHWDLDNRASYHQQKDKDMKAKGTFIMTVIGKGVQHGGLR